MGALSPTTPVPISFILIQFSAKILPNNFVPKSGVDGWPPRRGYLRPTTVKSKYFNLNKIKRKQFRKTFVQSNFSCNIQNLPCLAFTIEQSFQKFWFVFQDDVEGILGLRPASRHVPGEMDQWAVQALIGGIVYHSLTE